MTARERVEALNEFGRRIDAYYAEQSKLVDLSAKLGFDWPVPPAVFGEVLKAAKAAAFDELRGEGKP